MPSALIFDFDGLLLDTEVPVYEAWRENYLAHGCELPIETYAACVGSDFGGFDPKSHLEAQSALPIDWEHWDPLRERLALEGARRLGPMPGVLALLDAAAERGIPCAVASSSPRSWVEGHLERLDLLPRFAATRCLDDVAAPKPAPDLFLAALEALGVAAREALVLEDSLNGLRAARAAGIACVVVPNRITSHLAFDGAAAVLASLDDAPLAALAAILRDFSRREGAEPA